MTITAADIRARLVEKYAFKDGWITMAEVTPPKCSRRFALPMNLGRHLSATHRRRMKAV